MNQNSLVIFFMMVLTVTIIPASSALDCSVITSFSPNVCLFSTSQQLNFIDQSPSATLCQATNTNPFNNGAMTSTGFADRDRCNTAVREDGSACIELYAKFQCSSVCPLCLEQPCKSYCDNIHSACPGATAAGCFTQLPPCASSNTGCTDWSVDKSKLPSAISTTTTKATGSVTTATTTTTTTHTGTTSGASPLIDTCMLFLCIGFMMVFVLAAQYLN